MGDVESNRVSYYRSIHMLVCMYLIELQLKPPVCEFVGHCLPVFQTKTQIPVFEIHVAQIPVIESYLNVCCQRPSVASLVMYLTVAAGT